MEVGWTGSARSASVSSDAAYAVLIATSQSALLSPAFPFVVWVRIEREPETASPKDNQPTPRNPRSVAFHAHFQLVGIEVFPFESQVEFLQVECGFVLHGTPRCWDECLSIPALA
jgi:hypothetical protein